MYKILILIALILAAGLLLAAETTALDSYFADPNPQSFISAYNYCKEQVSMYSNSTSFKILLASLVNMETQRLTEVLTPYADTLGSGETFQYANLLLAQNRYEETLPLYGKLNADYPTWSCPWRHKGQALYQLKRYKEAEASLTQAIATNVEHYDAYIWQAKTQYQLKKYKLALQNLETAKTLNANAEASEDGGISNSEINQLYTDLLDKMHKTK